MKYICMGFADPEKLAQTPPEEMQRMIDECLAYDAELRRSGHYVGGHALDVAKNAVTLRMKNGQIDVTDGPFIETKESLGGILVLEARDLNHAISLMSKHPGVKMGPFEIRPVNEEFTRMILERIEAIAAQG